MLSSITRCPYPCPMPVGQDDTLSLKPFLPWSLATPLSDRFSLVFSACVPKAPCDMTPALFPPQILSSLTVLQPLSPSAPHIHLADYTQGFAALSAQNFSSSDLHMIPFIFPISLEASLVRETRPLVSTDSLPTFPTHLGHSL